MAKQAMVTKTGKCRYEKVMMAKMDAEANDIVLAALIQPWDFWVTTAKLYRLYTPYVDLDKPMKKATGLLLTWTRTTGTDILPPFSLHDKTRLGGKWQASNREGKEVIPVAVE